MERGLRRERHRDRRRGTALQVRRAGVTTIWPGVGGKSTTTDVSSRYRSSTHCWNVILFCPVDRPVTVVLHVPVRSLVAVATWAPPRLMTARRVAVPVITADRFVSFLLCTLAVMPSCGNGRVAEPAVTVAEFLHPKTEQAYVQ
ncbi:hypothetical protein [Curtobacterium sp. BRD11]|uniref:hypothetical protein n=1 Tax=Curtobacterium sp. BRD11 TaxID=2962581 RepID=UPI002881B3B0|nr:hypothetical protein [Curtobacterium sp. BRD11]MDT0211545.1 hypothetical protein [Curtobacterium sp. BRD11]